MDALKVLVFGDGRNLFQTIRWVLEYKGHRVSLAPNPEAALARLIDQNFDLIIAKLQMEDLPNLDVLKRAQKLNPQVSIMVVSGDLNAGFPLEAYQIKVDDYLLLPIMPSALLRRVGRCLEEIARQKQARLRVVAKRGANSEKIKSHAAILLHDIRNSLVSSAASLKLIKRGKYGPLDSEASQKLQEVTGRLHDSTDLILRMAHEMLPRPPQETAVSEKPRRRGDHLKPVPSDFLKELRQPAEPIEVA